MEKMIIDASVWDNIARFANVQGGSLNLMPGAFRQGPYGPLYLVSGECTETWNRVLPAGWERASSSRWKGIHRSQRGKGLGIGFRVAGGVGDAPPNPVIEPGFFDEILSQNLAPVTCSLPSLTLSSLPSQIENLAVLTIVRMLRVIFL
jgi:hypothetical protein